MFLAPHEGDDTSQVALEGQDHQIKHQPGILRIGGQETGRPLHVGKFSGGLFLGQLNAPLDIANGIEIFGELAAVTGSELPQQASHTLGDRIQDTALFLDQAAPLGRVGAALLTEQAFENPARVMLHGERRGGTAP